MGPLVEADEDVAAVGALCLRSLHFRLSACLRAVRETLGLDRISGSLFLARATERQSGRALSQ